MAARGAAIAAANRRAAAASAAEDEALAERMTAGVGALADSARQLVVSDYALKRHPPSIPAKLDIETSTSQRPQARSTAQLSTEPADATEPRRTFRDLALESPEVLQGRLPEFLSQQGSRWAAAENDADPGPHGDDSGSIGSSARSRTLTSIGSSSSEGSGEYHTEFLQRACPVCCSQGQASGSWLKVRRIFRDFTASRAFRHFILLCILGNTVTLAMSNPLDTDSGKARVLELFELAFTCIFTAEMLLKFLALVSCCAFECATHMTNNLFLQGVFVSYDPNPEAKRPYFASGWNRLDLIIVAVSLLEFIPGKHARSRGHRHRSKPSTCIYTLNLPLQLSPLAPAPPPRARCGCCARCAQSAACRASR